MDYYDIGDTLEWVKDDVACGLQFEVIDPFRLVIKKLTGKAQTYYSIGTEIYIDTKWFISGSMINLTRQENPSITPVIRKIRAMDYKWQQRMQEKQQQQSLVF